MKFLLSTLFSLLLCSTALAQGTIVMVAEEFPPFSYLEEGEYKGIDVDILKEASKRLGVEIKIQFYPWARAMAKVKKGEANAIFGVYRNSDREQYFYYADEPLSYETAVLVVPESSTRKANMLEDIEGWRVAQLRDTSYSDQFDAYMQIERVWVHANKQSLELLNRKRVDAAIFNELVFNYRKAVLDEMLDFKKLDLTVSKEPQHVVFSKAMGPSHKLLAEKYSVAIKQLRKEGVINKIVRSYSSISVR